MPGRVYVHIGLPKTGTSYLQETLWRNRDELARVGVYLPGGGRLAQRYAVWDLLGRRIQGAGQPFVAGAWKALVEDVARSPSEQLVLSEEFLVHARPPHARRMVRAFQPREVHVIVTVRDLGRVIASMWQQNTGKARTVKWTDFVAAVREPERGPATAGVGFWLRYDLRRTLAVWETVVPPERIHVVAVPPAGSSPTLLWERFTTAVSIDGTHVKLLERERRQSVSAVEAEVLRRLNVGLDGNLSEEQYLFMIGSVLRPAMRKRSPNPRIKFPVEHRAWVLERSEEQVEFLRNQPYDLVGDMGDLRPHFETDSGEDPDEVSDAAIAHTALALLSATVQGYAEFRSRSQAPAEASGRDTDSMTRWASLRRSLDHRTRVRLLELADHHRFVARMANTYLRRSSRS